MKVFIPITDEMLEAGVIPAEPVAYQVGVPLLSQLQKTTSAVQSRSSVSRSPTSTPSLAASPAFNSSTNLAGKALG